jgi:AraC-like DNA-binding protein
MIALASRRRAGRGRPRSSVVVVSYAERLLPSPLVACTWEQSTAAECRQRVVPDACVDLIFSGERLTLAGPDTEARIVVLAPGTHLVGARLRPGMAGSVLEVPPSELQNASVDATDVLGRDATARLLEQLAANCEDAHELLARALARHVRREPDPLVSAAIEALGLPGARVGAVAADLGVSARQLQRRVRGAVGYGPKMLARVLRFRRLQMLPPAPLVELALDAGYADQAHMTAEVTRLAGISPVRFLKDGAPTAA